MLMGIAWSPQAIAVPPPPYLAALAHTVVKLSLSNVPLVS